MECTTATMEVSTPANMITGPLEDTIKAQVEPRERSKRDREYGQPSQESPRPVTHTRKQVLKGRTAKNGDKTAVQTGIEQYGFGPTAGGGTQKRKAKKGPQPSKEGGCTTGGA